MSKLFSVPISSGAGVFECTSPKENVYLISFESAPDNRMKTPFIEAFLLTLDIIEQRYPRGVVITTSSIAKFYSNGFDLQHNIATPNFQERFMTPLLKRLLVYPMPTIALINGHCFGAGIFAAFAHDYRFQNPSKGFLCLPEIDLGVVIPLAMQQMFKQKITNPEAYRAMALEGRRIGGTVAHEMGVVDGLGGLDEALAFVDKWNLVTKAQTGVWGQLKEGMYLETLQLMGPNAPRDISLWQEDMDHQRADDEAKAKARVAEFLASSRSKL